MTLNPQGDRELSQGAVPLVSGWLEDGLVIKVFCSVHLPFSWDLVLRETSVFLSDR